MHHGLLRSLFALTLGLSCCLSAAAAPPADVLLPSTTRGFVSIPNLAELESQFAKTQLGQLAQDPAMKSFSNDLKRQFDEKLSAGYERLGLQLDDIRDMASGEVAAATVHDGKEPAGTAVIIHIKGREEQAKQRLEQVFARLKAEKYTQKSEKEQDTLLEIFDRPADPKIAEPARQVVYFLREDLLCCTDQLALSRELLSRFVEQPANNLANLDAYKHVAERCQRDAGEAQPHLRWFIEPLAYATAMRDATPKPAAHGGAQQQDTLQIMKNQGFGALRGVGGSVQFYPQDGKYELLHRTALYAPEPFELAMRMVKLPNVDGFEPPVWASRKLARWSALSLDVQNAFEMSASLFDEVVGGKPGTFQNVLKDIKADVNGPQVDIKQELVTNLDSRITVLVDYHTPGVNDSGERRVIAIKSSNPDALKVAIEKVMKADRTALPVKLAGDVTVWEISPNAGNAAPGPPVQNGPPRLRRKGPPQIRPINQPPQPQAQQGGLMQRSAVTVAHGHLLIATHADALKEILAEVKPEDQLINDPEYQETMRQLNELAPGAGCARVFTRTREARRVGYELFKEGKLRQSDTLFARMINVILGEKPSAAQPQRVEAAELPEFKAIAHYFGPSGTSFQSEEQGFFAVGMLLKQPESASLEVAKDTTQDVEPGSR
ncbi:MAG: hypothetical protein SGJ19_03480 [Planctomycetia bacterium]|nr:hypothetical protein [Planctomycetia bacterium]